MIHGIGIDLVEVHRIKKRLDNEKFVQLVFSTNEISYCEQMTHPEQHFAGRFAAKEAYMKALGTGWTSESNFNEISVANQENGQPLIKLHGSSKSYFEKSNLQDIFVSISHTPTFAVAYVAITCKDNL